MRLNEGVEWGIPVCLLLARLADEAPISGRRLAESHELPTAYTAKQLQALVRAGVLTSTSGPRGGFRLARSADQISLLDIVDAIEGGAHDPP